MPLTRITERRIGFMYLLVVPAMIVFILVLLFLNYRQQDSRASKQAAANRVQIRILRQGLKEACHATTTQIVLVNNLILYLSAGPDSTAYRTQRTLNGLVGVANDLLTLTACNQISRP